MAEPPLASNNPFRRKSTIPVAASSPSAAAAPFTTGPDPGAFPVDVAPSASISKRSTFPLASPTASRPFTFDSEAAGYSGTSGAPSSPSVFEQPQQLRTEPVRQHPTGDEFREQLRALPKSSEAPPSTTFLKPKPVKKVRVQSPPPSSPDSVDADFEARFPVSLSAAGAATTTTAGYGDSTDSRARVAFEDRHIPNYDDYSTESDDSDDDDDDGRVDSHAKQDASRATFTSPASSAQTQQQRRPQNPFQKTLEDIESEAKGGGEEATTAETPAAVGKGALDVDAFSRLLLTGQAGSGASGGGVAPPRAKGAAPDAGSMTDASSTSKQSIFDTAHASQDTPRTSHEISETEDDRSGLIQATTPQTTGSAQRQTLRKKPPPPSSRHGRLIKSQKDKDKDKDKDREVEEQQPSSRNSNDGSGRRGSGRPSSSSSDVNKPLPPPPSRPSIDEDAIDSIFDREAAGKVPEVDLDPDVSDDAVPLPRPPTPPNASHSTSFSPSHPISDLGAEALLASASPPTAEAAPATPLSATEVAPSPAKKPTPAPPPRRQAHNRSDSKATVTQPAPTPVKVQLSGEDISEQQRQHHERSPVASPRSSIDSTRSRSSSLKLTPVNIPAPPPPRRITHGSRPSTSFISPSALSFGSVPSASSSPSAVSDNDRSPVPWPSANAATTSAAGSTATPDSVGSGPVYRGAAAGSGSSASTPNLLPSGTAVPATTKVARPPPPPARNASVRHKEIRPALPAGEYSAGSGSGRPPSISSVDAISRRIGPHSQPQPPPPPPRLRGSSRGSMDGPSGPASTTSTAGATPRKVSAGLPLAEEEENAGEGGYAQKSNDSSAAHDILADLDALQREVDALRGQYK